jgi:hypothetical protein
MLLVKSVTTALIAVAILPSAAYAITDPPSPVTLRHEVSATQDLRSPDTRDAERAVDAPPSRDLRSPDARDAARDVPVAAAESARVEPRRSAASVSDRFEWSDAGIGAAFMLALVSVTGATLLLISRSRHRAPTA